MLVLQVVLGHRAWLLYGAEETAVDVHHWQRPCACWRPLQTQADHRQEWPWLWQVRPLILLIGFSVAVLLLFNDDNSGDDGDGMTMIMVVLLIEVMMLVVMVAMMVIGMAIVVMSLLILFDDDDDDDDDDDYDDDSDDDDYVGAQGFTFWALHWSRLLLSPASVWKPNIEQHVTQGQ